MPNVTVDQDLAVLTAQSLPNVRVNQDLMVLGAKSNSAKVNVDQDLIILPVQRLVPAIIHTAVDQDLAILVVQRTLFQLVEITNGSGPFQDPKGIGINGYLTVRLNTEAQLLSNGNIIRFTTTIPVINGFLASNQVYSNAAFSPSNTYYAINLYQNDGSAAWGKSHTMVVPDLHPSVDINTIITL